MKKSGRLSSFHDISRGRRLRFQPIFFLLLVLLVGATQFITAGRPAGRQRTLSLDEINSQISAMQAKVDSLTQLQNQLRRDSSSLRQESSQQTASNSRKIVEIDDAIVRKKAMVNSLRLQYEKAKQDSIDLLASSREQTLALHKETVRLESSIITMSNELEVLSARRDQLDQPAPGTDSKTLQRLQAQITKSDSLIKARQAAFTDLTIKREKLQKDSVQAVSKLTGSRLEFRDQIETINKNIALISSALEQLEQKQAAIKGDKAKKISDLKANLTSLGSQKRALTDQITRFETEITALAGEKQRLARSADAALTKYTQLRKPFLQAAEDAEAALKRAVEEKALIKALREKLRLDSAVSKSRDLLDDAIKAEAEKKRGAKKLVEQRENDLNNLLNNLDGLIQNTPGIRQKEASVHAPTVSQKTGLVLDELAASEKLVVQATAARDKAKQNLAAFDAKNPPPADPSYTRTTALDSATNVKKKKIIQMTEQIDSISLVFSELQANSNALSKSLAGESGTGDSLTNAKRAEKASLNAKRAKLVKDSIQNETDNAGALPRLKTDLASIGNKLIQLQNEIGTLTADRDKTKESLMAAREKASQTATSQKTERQKFDSLIAAKQQEITLVSMKSEKLRQDSISLAKREVQQMSNLNTPPSTLGSQIAVAEKELNAMVRQSDSLKREVNAAQAKPAEYARRITFQIASTARSIDAANNDIAELKKEREAAYDRMKNDRGKLESMISSMEQEIAVAITKRDKARQDSVSAESNLRQASMRLQADIREKDNLVTGWQREVDKATDELERARDDSVRLAEKIPSMLQTYSQAAKSIDMLIAAKEKELADLKLRRDKARQDSLAENKKQLELLAKAHEEIVKRSTVVAQKKTESSLASADRKKSQTDTLSYKQKASQDLAAAAAEIERQNGFIERKKTDLAQLQKQRDEIATRFKGSGSTSASGSGTIITDYTPPASSPTFSPASAAPITSSPPTEGVQPPTPVEIAQLRSEELYTMLGENKIAEAEKRFRQLQGFLKTNLDAEAFQTLKMTIEEMSGSAR
jgi:chromosome segregation ATPase